MSRFNRSLPSTTGGQHQFARVPSANIPRSTFDRSCGLKTTFDSGLLIPIFVDEALPGDTFNMNATLFGRLATPLHPIMDNLYLDTFFFFVPNRIVWDNWERMMGEQPTPTSSTDFLTPTLDTIDWDLSGYEQSIFDYMGVPFGQGGIVNRNVNPISALPFRAFNLIYNEWFRDQNLQNPLPVATGDGPDDWEDYMVPGSKLPRRGKRHDYFTSALPFPQKGPDVFLPLGQSAPVTWSLSGSGSGDQNQITFQGASATASTDQGRTMAFIRENLTLPPADDEGYRLNTDLADATAATINQIREAFQLQKMFERDARGGTRYTEVIRSHFGVISPDARLQRPEYLGGGSTPIIINPVAQTSSTDGTSPQANLAAVGTVAASGHSFSKSFTEHGWIIGIASVRADLNYQQGLARQFQRRTRFDYYWPALAHLGEQEILSNEIFMQGDAADQDDSVFGYQERYAEYRYKPSSITGRFRSTASQSLDVWHLAQHFASRPGLTSLFIQENPPVSRVIAVPSEPEILLDAYFSFKCARPMPVFSVPGFVDHF